MSESEPTATVPWWRTSTALKVLAGLLVAGLVAVIVVVVRGNDDDSSGPADAGALVVARQEALNFFTIDYRHPEEDVAKVLELATGAFKDEYAAKQAQLIAQIKKEKVVTTASVPEGGVAVEFLHGNEARILVAVDVDQASGAKVFANRNRARIVLNVVDGRWLVTAVNQVG
ncbi:MAG: hypothetical protein EON52_13465 [Actinomycetales bacterium]|nr:MAG: hypothetical protein EON52_13465 [Actinomycetales bacterium]